MSTFAKRALELLLHGRPISKHDIAIVDHAFKVEFGITPDEMATENKRLYMENGKLKDKIVELNRLQQAWIQK